MRTGKALITVVAAATTLGIMSGLTGCGGSRFGSELSARPAPRRVSQIEGVKLRLPGDEAFSITLPQATKKPGLGGTAEADAEALASGSARATASVEQSGEAEGLFQLGHAFENATERQVDFDFTVSFHYAFKASATASDYPDAVVGLKLYARDGRGRLLRDLTLAEHSTENGPAERASDSKVTFKLTLSPDETLNLFVAGQTRVQIREGRSAAATLALSDLQMEVVTRPAPAVQSADDERR